ncbi:FecR family protein [Butyricimonas synergistica]|uniref:FecR family protein n=1 Tax=Butyricimonas synergistica TaxID=544644 RepID=UPI00036972FE|nr:FecR family protein [Butyricimonas synergistica]
MSEENLKIADIIFAYIEGSITGKQLEELKVWLDTSEKHRVVFQQLTRTDSFRDKEAVYRRFEQYYDFDQLKGRLREQRRIEWRYAAAVAAVVILPLLVAFLLLEWRIDPSLGKYPNEMSLLPGKSMATLTLSDGSTKPLNQENFALVDGSKRIVNSGGGLAYNVEDTIFVAEEVFNTIQVPRGAEYNVTLDDGTKVWLNSESYIRFPVTFLGEERRIQVGGEVFIDVAKDSRRPFIVDAGKLDVKALGTKFNIRAYREENCIMTTLVEGRVQVDDLSGKVTVLNPSEQLVYNKASGKNDVRKVDVELFVSWKDGVYLFESQRLENVMRLISKWYDVKVFYQNEGVKDIIFSGRLKRYENAETLLNVFESLGGVRFTVQGKIVVVEAE